MFGLLSASALIAGCGELDYENKEFYKNEVYIISSESTAASERAISALPVYTFKDTLKILNDNYETALIEDKRTGSVQVTFKIGVGGSLAAKQDIPVRVSFDEVALMEYNTENDAAYVIPDPSYYNVNVPYDEVSETFLVTVKAGTSSAALIFELPISRTDIDTYAKMAFPLTIVNAENAELSRQYRGFLVANLVVAIDQVVNWSGFPIPKLPEGRYHSARLQGNGAENTVNGVHHTYKFITRISDAQKDEGQFMVWGTGVWSFEVFGLHGYGWMYNRLFLNNQVYGTYTMEPILAGDPNLPAQTFAYGSVQNPSENNSYDPKTKTLTLYYKNVIGQDYTDVLTYVDDEFTLRQTNTGNSPTNWQQLRQLGYPYWLPSD